MLQYLIKLPLVRKNVLLKTTNRQLLTILVSIDILSEDWLDCFNCTGATDFLIPFERRSAESFPSAAKGLVWSGHSSSSQVTSNKNITRYICFNKTHIKIFCYIKIELDRSKRRECSSAKTS